MDFFTPRAKNSLLWLSLPLAIILAVLPNNRSIAGLEWVQLNKAMETKTQLFVDHAWKPMYGQKSAKYIGDFEWLYPQGYWRLMLNAAVKESGVQQTIHKNVKKGTPVTFVFFANPDFKKDSALRFSLKSAKAPQATLWTKVVKIDYSDSGWKQHYYRVAFPCPEIKAEETLFTATIELPVSHCEFGSCWFYITGGQDPLEEKVVAQSDNGHKLAEKALQEAEIAKRVDRQRKGKLSITVRDQAGKPLPDAVVKIKQTRQAFTFGCVLRPNQLADPQFQQSKSAKAIFSLFNSTLLEMDWATLEKTKGQPDFGSVDISVDLLKKNNFSIIAALWSPSEITPAWFGSKTSTSGSAVRSFVSSAVSHLSKNVSGFQFSLDQKGAIGQWIDQSTPKLAGEKLIVWSHLAGADEKSNLILRVDNAEKLKRIFEMMTSDGTAPNGISVSLPLLVPLWKDTDDWLILQSLKSLNTDIYFLGWIDPATKSSAPGEKEINALKRRYLAAFSNPWVKAIIFPDPIDNSLLVSTTGATTNLYKQLYSLVHNEWSTNFEGRTDSAGKLTNRAFYGDYEISADDQKGHTAKTEISLSPHEGPKEVILTIKN